MSQTMPLCPEDRDPSKAEFFLEVLGRRNWAVLFSASALIAAGTAPLAALPGFGCSFLSLTGYPCPFCGTTRSFWAMAQGEISPAFYNSPIGALLYPAAWVMLIHSLLAASIELILGKTLRLFPLGGRAVAILLSGAFTANWIYRLAMGFK